MDIIKQLDKVNAERCEVVFNMPLEDLKLNELSNMIAAEAGELSGICHKIEMGCYPHSMKYNKLDLENEIADVFITLHLLSSKLNIDLAAVVKEKFNAVSIEKRSSIII